ncbi:DinB family protein [Dyadobacter sandarakinus]|uniref:DinB family protein n=1 Tax=Dyadobacter sandarakinus TaxID=2747268 RepID=A0ABX7I8Q0_9BACT|nr:DinB family protein [Dyadobacter sandarakinus]QRR02479.1 DinB family protein [Dyadobacter sandarakinus]
MISKTSAAMSVKRQFHITFGHTKDHSIDYLTGILLDSRLTTVQSIEKLTVSQLDWQYAPGWNTIGALLSHMEAIEHFFRIEFVLGRKLTTEENGHWTPALDMGEHLPKLITGKSVDQYMHELTASRQMLVDAVRHLSFEEFTRKIEGYYDEQTGCNLAWALYHMMEDEIYHRGQISMIRKLYAAHHGSGEG